MKTAFKVRIDDSSKFSWSHHQSNPQLAVFFSQSIKIYTKRGELVSEIPIDTKCLILRWSPVGDYLAIVQEKNVLKWSLLGGTTMFNMPRGVKCMDLVDWSNTGILAVACRKGKILLITNDNNIHLLDKHLNPISSLKWNSKNELATCAVDNTVTLSDDQGQTTSSVLLKTTINNLKWDNNSNQAVLAAVGNNQSIVLFLNGVLTSRVELVTSAKYGSIMDYFFMTDQILVAMEKAQILILSIHGDSMGKLQSVHKIYSEYLSSIDISIKPGKMVTIGDDCVKLQDLDFKSSEQLFPLHDSKRQNAEVEFEPFGQMLTAKFGSELSVIQLSETQLFKYWRSRLVCSIGSSINFIEFDSGEFQSFDCNFEATTVYVGPKYVSAVGGMQVWHQEVDSGFSPSAGNSRYISQFNENLKTKDSLPCISNYPFVVKFVYTNSDFVLVTAASTESFLHQISDDPKSEKDLLEFPGNGVHVVDAHFTDTHLIYQTAFEIIYWDCQEMVECIKYQHSCQILNMFVKHDNTTIVSFIDNQQKGYVFATSTGFVTEIKNWKVDTIGMLWQLGGCNSAELLIGWSTSQMYIYAYHPSTWKEPSAAFLLVASVDFPLVQQPLLFKNDNLIYFGRDEKINSYVLQCFKELDTGEMASKYPTEADKIEYLKTLSTLGKSPCLRKYEACISSPKIWSTVAEHMLMHLQINDAKMIYGEILHDLGMTKTLQRIQLVEDKYEVQGHIAVLFEMFQYAKDCFLKSCSPKEAVFLFMDLLEWKDALKLAEEHAPDQLGKISFEYAMQLEIQGKHSDALSLLSRVPLQSSNSSLEKERNDGVIRMTCATGNVINAMNLLHNVRDPIILKECALLLESISQFKEAATLLEKGEFWEEAAMCWIKSKNFHRAEMALNRAKSKQPYIVLGDAYVKEKMYLEADTAYKMAEHYDGVVSVLIDCLADLEGGAEQARKTKSFESCKSLGNHFSRVGNHARAIEFYVLSGLNNKAFRIATERNLMHEFISFMEDNDFIPLQLEVAAYFESKRQFLDAATFYFKSMRYEKCLNLCMSTPDMPGALDLAIEAVVDSQDEKLIRNLIDFLIERTDGTREYSKFLLTLQNALGNHEEAIEIAQVVAERESQTGNFRIAQDILLKTYRECRMKRIPLPMEFKESIMILHSYALVKILLRADDHKGAARMLARVSQNINRFPAHKISILTAATMKCYRTGQFRNAKEIALILTQPENQPSVDPKYLPSIEQIAAGNLEDEGLMTCSSCPYCNAPVEDYNLNCDDCKRILPFCIASGKHMVVNGWTECPHCRFPAIFLQFKKLLAITKCCPMCNEIVESASLAMKRIDNVLVVPKDEVLTIAKTRNL